MALLNGTSNGQRMPQAPQNEDNSDLVSDDQTMNGETPEGAESEGAESEGDDEEDDGTSPVVLCTVMDNRDGTYSLIIGDEPEDMDGMAAPEGASPAAGGVPAMPEGKVYEGAGPLLKAVLDVIRESESESGAADEQASFENGFSGGSAKQA